MTWAFEFEDQPYFAGFRDLATNGIDKPVLNVFRMLGRMRGDRVAVESSGALPLDLVRDTGVRDKPDVNALASRSERTVSILVWNYHDDDLPAPPADVELLVDGVDGEIGRGDAPARRRDAQQRLRSVEAHGIAAAADARRSTRRSRRRGSCSRSSRPGASKVEDGRVRLPFALPRQAVSLVRVTW